MSFISVVCPITQGATKTAGVGPGTTIVKLVSTTQAGGKPTTIITPISQAGLKGQPTILGISSITSGQQGKSIIKTIPVAKGTSSTVCQKKNYNRTFSINSFRNLELIWICFRIIKVSLIICFSAKTIRFGSVVRNKDFCKARHKYVPSKFWQKGESHYTMNTEFHTPFEWFMSMCRQNLDGRDLWHT